VMVGHYGGTIANQACVSIPCALSISGATVTGSVTMLWWDRSAGARRDIKDNLLLSVNEGAGNAF